MIAEYYYTFYLLILIILTCIISNRNRTAQIYFGDKTAIRTSSMSFLMWFTILYIGLRPYHPIFADTMGYVMRYENEIIMPASFHDVYYSNDIRNEWLWHFILMGCARLGLPSWCYLTLISLGYVGFGALAIRRIFRPNHRLIAFIFFVGAFSFWSYGVNGLRNGLSFSIVLLAFTYLKGGVKNYLKFGILSFIAYNIHHTAMLPLGCMLISHFFLKNCKFAFGIWLLSIPASLIAPGFFESILMELSPDERLADNINAQHKIEMMNTSFSHSGFRWDFLLYSVMPIILGYIVVFKHKTSNRIFINLLNVYLLCNAFWILVIRASFSNRFAYLSWFIYPFVIAYPLLELHFIKNQRAWISNILLAYIGFTAFMHFIFYS